MPHPSGLPGAFDRGLSALDRVALLFLAGNLQQPSEFNELQTLLQHQMRRVGNMVAQSGDRRSGAGVVVVPDDPATTGTLRLAEGEIYVEGLTLPVAARDIAGVSMTGDVSIGVRVQTTWITHEDDASLLGIDEGTLSFGEAGAARELRTLVWATEDDAQEGDFAQVYLLRNGAVVDNEPPLALTGIMQQMSVYDHESNGHYIVDGCKVVALGKDGDDQIFSIGAGTANIQGWKRVREAALRLPFTENPDLERIDLEPHTYVDSGDGSALVTVHRPPISNVLSATVTKQITETVTRGAVAGGSDLLGQSSIVQILSVDQGSTFAESTYSLEGNSISWANPGAEPAQASTYDVTYLFYDAVSPAEVTDTTVRLTGGVVNQPITITYDSKLPRIDMIGLNQIGAGVVVEGVSARRNLVPPKTPGDILKLAEVRHDWTGKPTVTNNGTRNYTYDQQRRLFELLETIVQQFDRSELQRDASSRDAVTRDGIFTDLFRDDFFRDGGGGQTAATNQGLLQLAVDRVDLLRLGGSHMLDWTEEVVLSQLLATRPLRINPYANFLSMPGALRLDPPTDTWTEHETQFTSEETREFVTAPGQPPGRTSFTQEVSETVTAAETLRSIDIDFTIEGFSANEDLETLLFDGVDITPDPVLTADLNGQISGTFTIPPLVPTGARQVRAEGAAGGFAEALFVGQGTIETELMRRVNLVTRSAPVPIVNFNTTNITNVTNEINVTNITNRITQVVNGGNNGGGGGGNDPLAQTFTLLQGRHIAGANIRLAAIGDPNNGVRVQLCTTINGFPTDEVLAEDFLSMQGRSVGDVMQARWPIPVYLPPNREFCFVILTDDGEHALSIARMGDVIPETDQLVSTQPYTVGVLFSSSNRVTWTPHQEDDLWFELIGARFTANERTIDLFTGTLAAFTDLVIRGAVEVPTAGTGFRYELVRAGGEVIRLAPEQPLEFDELVDEEITLRCVLSGNGRESPVLWPGTTLLAGRVRTEGTYVTKVWPINGASKAVAIFAQDLPAGSGITVEMDKADDNWVSLAVQSSRNLGGGWQEPTYEISPHDAPLGGRLRITLTGGAGARPSLAELRAYAL